MTEVTSTAIYQEAEEGGYIGYVAELPGANTQGNAGRSARKSIRGNSVDSGRHLKGIET
jgi:predicted RNase H-like HicB family nuclease